MELYLETGCAHLVDAWGGESKSWEGRIEISLYTVELVEQESVSLNTISLPLKPHIESRAGFRD